MAGVTPGKRLRCFAMNRYNQSWPCRISGKLYILEQMRPRPMSTSRATLTDAAPRCFAPSGVTAQAACSHSVTVSPAYANTHSHWKGAMYKRRRRSSRRKPEAMAVQKPHVPSKMTRVAPGGGCLACMGSPLPCLRALCWAVAHKMRLCYALPPRVKRWMPSGDAAITSSAMPRKRPCSTRPARRLNCSASPSRLWIGPKRQSRIKLSWSVW